MELLVFFVSLTMMHHMVHLKHVKDEYFELPVLENVAQNIGDLWEDIENTF